MAQIERDRGEGVQLLVHACEAGLQEVVGGPAVSGAEQQVLFSRNKIGVPTKTQR